MTVYGSAYNNSSYDIDVSARSSARNALSKGESLEVRLKHLEAYLGIHWDEEEEAYFKRTKVNQSERGE